MVSNLSVPVRSCNTTCRDNHNWLHNCLQKSLCAVLSLFQSSCTRDALAVQQSSSQNDHNGDANTAQTNILCKCSTMANNLFTACEAVQKRSPPSYGRWTGWQENCIPVSLSVPPLEKPQGTEECDQTDISAIKVKLLHRIIARDVVVTNTTASRNDTDSAAPTETTQKFRMSPAISGVVGALCALVIGLVIGAGVVLYIRRRRRLHDKVTDAEQTGRFPFAKSSYYKARHGTSTSSYVGLREMPMDGGSKFLDQEQSVMLITQEAADLLRASRPSESSLLLPDNLYIPNAVEVSPADESSRVCATPGTTTAESGVLGFASKLENEDHMRTLRTGDVPKSRHIKSRSQTM